MEPRACPGCQHQEEFHGTRYDKRWCAICEGPCSHDPSKLAALRKQRERAAKQLGEVMDRMADDYTAARVDSTNRITDLEAQLVEAKAERDKAKSDHGNLYLRYVNVVECDLRMACADRDSANQRLAHLEAALAKVRELQRMDREMMAADALFVGSNETRCILISDTFAYACADAEEVSDEELPALYAFWKEHDYAGLTAWVANKRGMEPIKPAATDAYRKAREALAATGGTRP